MENSPLISVICLCYNQAQFVIESLESIKNQYYKNFEILICDDSSRDNSVEVVDSWIKDNPEIPITFVKHKENKGISKSLNDLLNLSIGKYIQLLALDDLLMPDKFERHVTMLENAPDNYVMVFSDANLIDQNSNLYQNKFLARHLSYLSLKSQNYYDMLLDKNFLPAMSVLMKRDPLVQEGGFDENLTCEDHDMWLRLSRKYDFLFDETVSCSYRLHPNNSHKQKNVMNEATYFKTMIKHKENPLAKNKIFQHLENIYLLKALKDEHKIYYGYFPVASFPENCIKYNLKPIFYRLALALDKTWAFLKSPY
jgi:glycosyltransferase involved in cell wall biosynthesis